MKRRETTWAELEAANLAAPDSFRFPVEVKEGKWKGRWLDEQQFDCDTICEGKRLGICRPEIGASERSRIPRTTLRKHAQLPSRWNNGEPIFTIKVRPPIIRDDPEIRLFPDRTTDPVAEKYQKDHDAAGIDSNGAAISDDTYLAREELRKTLSKELKEKGTIQEELSKKFIKNFIDAFQARLSRLRKGSKARPEYALRSRLGTSPDRSRVRTEQLEFRLGDARGIFKGEEGSHPLTGKPAHPRPGALTDDEARALIQEYFLEKGPTIRDTFYKFCRERLISIRQRKLAVKKLKIKMEEVGGGPHKVCYYFLPGQEISREIRLKHAPQLRKVVELTKAFLGKDERPRPRLLKYLEKNGSSESKFCEALALGYLPLVSKRIQQGSSYFHMLKLVNGSSQATEICPVQLTCFGEPIFVDGRRKTVESFSAFKVIAALVAAWPKRLSKDEIEKINTAARRILKGLRRDPDWAIRIMLPGLKNNGYGIA